MPGGLESLIPKKQGSPSVPPVPPVPPRVPRESNAEPTQPHQGQSASDRNPANVPQEAPQGWPHRESFRDRVSAAKDPSRSPVPKIPSRPPDSVFQIEIEKIKPNPYQPRRDFDDEELRELADSIRQFGVIQPLVVSKIVKETPTGTDVEYQLVAGERRLMASKIAGLERVPVIVRTMDTHRAKLEIALIENIQRSSLNPLEAARAYARLSEEFGLTQREIASRIGKSREVIANSVRLLNLPQEVQDALSRGKINESQARTLLTLGTAHEQLKALEQLLEEKLSVRALRDEVAGEKNGTDDPEVSYWKRKIEEELGAPVKITKRGERGKLSIQFFSEAEWKNIVERLLGPDTR